MPAELSVRRYGSEDAAAVWAVHEAALQASPLPFVEDAPTDADLRAIEAEYLDAGGEFLVGEVDGADERSSVDRVDADASTAIVAIGGYQPVDDRTAELRRMRVHPDHQRRGYGRRLLAALEARARDAGFEAIELETVEHLRAALALYRDAGYEVVARDAHPATGDERLTLRRRL